MLILNFNIFFYFKAFDINDYGTYGCIATNNLGSKSTLYTISELANNHLNKKEVKKILEKINDESYLLSYFDDNAEDDDSNKKYNIDYSNCAINASNQRGFIVFILYVTKFLIL